jgi:DUF177 domain-containing protein
MIIKISNLSEGFHNYTFDEPVDSLELNEPFFGSVKAQVELTKSLNQIFLDVAIEANVDFECDRCAVDYQTVLKTNYKMVYFFGENPDGEAEDTNVTYLAADADKISIDKDVRDYAILGIPMKKLCREDCKGLCIHCGKNLNEGECGCRENEIDLRWQPLMELKNKLNTN